MLTFIAETREYVWGELRNGDRPDGKQIGDHLRQVHAALPPGVKRIFGRADSGRSEEHTSELQSPCNLVCRLLLEKKKNNTRARRRRERDPASTGRRAQRTTSD